MSSIDKKVDFQGQIIFIDLVIPQIKIQTTLFSTDRTTGYRDWNQRPEQMHRRMHPHVLVSSVPIDCQCDFVTYLEAMRFIGKLMVNRAGLPVFTCIDYVRGFVRSANVSSIAWLTSAQGVENRLIKFNHGIVY